ncbi:large T antigen [Betapolyomavirus calbifrons]|uniref:Large T antigen n=1 Tax=Betapolyomavirus calbifrons TaxID=1236392 RepID=K7QJK1_9POLY|nr:large T antigen [Betapolyomavirus calbifrons]AFU25615.3 large T antigen [Betapolyomavirus calbifrons]
MDHTLTRDESKLLMELLNLPMEQYGNFPLMRKAFLQKCKILHPDKGGDQETAKMLISLYKRLEAEVQSLNTDDCFTTDQPTYGTEEWDQWWQHFNKDFDLFCNETFTRSSEEEDEEGQKRKYSDSEEGCSQATPPKKKKTSSAQKDMPEQLKSFLSNAILSNKTINSFLIYTTLEKSGYLYCKLLEKFKPTFISRHKFDMEGLLFVITPTKHRVSAISNFCHNLCSVSFVLVKGVIKEFNCYCALCIEPFSLLSENIPGGLSSDYFDAPVEPNKNVSWKLVANYALDIMCDDIFLLMGLYKEFAFNPTACEKCDAKLIPDHYKYHKDHYDNALLFDECKNQKPICQQAVDGVIAFRRVETSQLTRKQQLTKRFLKHFKKMDDIFAAKSEVTIENYLAGVCWFEYLLPAIDMKNFILEYLDCVVANIPKRRYWCFTGPVNTGKTTLAAALLDLCGGKSLNVNMPFDKLNFELGVAIDQFTVVFEDVKGQTTENQKLPTGQGISNLDHLRDYLDGAVKVNLEKKHLNKKTQIFPPGLVTANEYKFPVTLKVRFVKMIKFIYQSHLSKSLKYTESLAKHRILQSGLTLLILLIFHCEATDFVAELQPLVTKWKQYINDEVSWSRYQEMKENVLKGINILTKHEDSGIFTQSQSQSQDTQCTV